MAKRSCVTVVYALRFEAREISQQQTLLLSHRNIYSIIQIN